ncbi:MAG: hypothetical protein AAF840_15400 [Bacteroidota bacterium]
MAHQKEGPQTEAFKNGLSKKQTLEQFFTVFRDIEEFLCTFE